MGFRNNFRDKKAWLDTTNGCIDLNTNDAAAKWYDASVTQLCGWYEDQSIGGLAGSIRMMLEADPDFKLGRLYQVELNLMGSMDSPAKNPELEARIESLKRECQETKTRATEHEMMHLDVVLDWADNRLSAASKKLEKLITEFPEDMMALKMLQSLYFVQGRGMPMRNSLAYSLSKMSTSNPLKGYAHGMFAFAFEESNMYQESQAQVMKALELIPRDTWGIHTYAHCLEMQGKVEEGLKWMDDKKVDWQPCSMLACHQFWHTALFNINNSKFDEAIRLLDEEVLARAHDGCTTLDMNDAASMIHRMQIVDLFERQANESTDLVADNKRRWSLVYDLCKDHARDHLWGFNDAHFMMTFLGADRSDKVEELTSSLAASSAMSADVKSTVASLLEAMRHFHSAEYERCVQLLEEIRFDILGIGGSHAQRDVFEQILIVAAMRSSKEQHNKLAERMIIERDAIFGRRLPQTQLLADQLKKRQ